jgi:Lon-like protease
VVGAATATNPAEERVRAKRAALARHPLLAGCSALTVRRFAAFADEVRVPAGEVVVEQGHHGLWFFVIDRGEAEVVRDGVCTGMLGPGQHFGEAAVLRQVLQPATVRARTDLTVYVIGCQRLVPLVRDTRALRGRLGDVVHTPRPVAATRTTWVPARAVDHRLPHRPAPRRRRWRWAVLGGLTAVAAFAATWHPPLAVAAPGRPFDAADDITITGATTTPVHGRYLVPTVRVGQPTLLGLGVALLHPHRHIVPARDVFPPGTTAESRRRAGREAFRRSQLLGAAAGARAAGLTVHVANSAQAPTVDLPFSVRFRPRDVTGPSAGLAYALAVEDVLDVRDLAQGRTIVATGDVQADGRVSPVGFVAQKAPVATGARAAILLVPDVEVTEAWGNGLRVDGVGSLADAVARLR